MKGIAVLDKQEWPALSEEEQKRYNKMIENIMIPAAPNFCQFCTHLGHGAIRCPKCRCKGKARWWQKILGGVGEAIGEAKFDD